MSERYTKLFSLPENLYAEGAPVIVSAGNLLKDNQTGKVLAQLKIKNISARPLKAATVLIRPQDAAGKPMEGDTQQKYLDLTAKTGEEFGQKTAVFLPDASARGFTVNVTQVVFSDNSTWEGTAAPWEPLPAPESLSEKLGDAELVKQYKLQFGGACETVPQEHGDLWLCACGAWNRGENCHVCGKDKEVLLPLDLDTLKANKDARLATEKAEREAKKAADKAAAEASARKTKKALAIGLPLIAVCAATLLVVTGVIIPNGNYDKAKALLDAGQYEEAISAFEALNGYKDSAEQLTAAKKAKADEEHAAAEAKAEEKRLAEEARLEAENAAAYENAEALLAAEDYDGAVAAFRKLGEYRDSAQKAADAQSAKLEMLYRQAEALAQEGKYFEAAGVFSQIKDYKDSRQRFGDLVKETPGWSSVSAGATFTVALRKDGTVLAVGNNKAGQCDVTDWRDIVSVSASNAHVVGLRADGTVVAAGTNNNISDSSFDFSDWEDIVAVFTGYHSSVGLRADGTVVADGLNRNSQKVSDWTDIIAAAAGGRHFVGLRADGTVLAAGLNEDGQCSVSNWTNILSIAAGYYHTVGLRADGTVLAAGLNKNGQCDVTKWRDVVAVSAGFGHTVGLRADGTVLAAGSNEYGQCDVSGWTDIIAVSAGSYHTVGLRADGTVIAVGRNDSGQCNVSDWTDIMLP